MGSKVTDILESGHNSFLFSTLLNFVVYYSIFKKQYLIKAINRQFIVIRIMTNRLFLFVQILAIVLLLRHL